MFSFLSIEFSICFTVFFAVYWLFYKKPQIQNFLLLLFSYFVVYKMAGWLAISILAGFTVFIFIINQKIYHTKLAYQELIDEKEIEPEEIHSAGKGWFIVGILLSLINLILFKYYDFFATNIRTMLESYNLDSSYILANIIFPLGISYYTFQAISYLHTTYKNTDNPKSLTFLQTCVYFSSFMTISAGPIARIDNTKGLNDIQGNPCGMYEQITAQSPRKPLLPILAFSLLILALLKKWWLASYLADTWVNPVFANPEGFHSLEILTAIYGYTLQLFLDFSGYSEMMVAFALLLGFKIPMNFNQPLLAHNIREFWDRWHISLSTWIRDYIYIPLGGSRKGLNRTQINLIIAMGLSGIWHGSTINFLLWGLLHGVAISLLNIGDKVCQILSGQKKQRNFLANSGVFGKIISVIITVHFVAFAFVFFRATTFDESRLIFESLVNNYINVAWVNNPLYLLFILLIAWMIYPFSKSIMKSIYHIMIRIPSIISYVLLFILFMIIVVFAPSGIPGFIYANF